MALSSDTGGDTCRVTMVAPRVRIDVALPTAVPLASLLPTLLWHSGEQLAEEGLAHGGWALQRAGDGPLDTAASVAALGIRDGDILYLRPRQEALPAAVYDDAADAIVTTLRDQARRWRPEHARAAALAAMGVVLLTGAATLAGLATPGLATPGLDTPRLAVAGIAAAAAVLALLGAVAASRAFGDALAGTVLGAGALPFAFLAGLDGTGTGAGGPHGTTPPEFLAGVAALLVTAAIAAVAVGDPGSMLTGALAAGLIAVACSLLALVTSGAGAAAVAICLALALTPVIAPVAYRLAGLPRPAVPASAEELRQRGEPLDAASITARTMTADRVVTAMVAATGVVAVAGIVVMLTAHGWGETALAGLASCLLLLRARAFAGAAQRAWLTGSGLAGLAVFGAVAAPRLGTAGAVGVLCALTVAVVVLASAAIAPGRRVAPPARRLTDMLDLMATGASIPLALQVLHVFGMARSLGGLTNAGAEQEGPGAGVRLHQPEADRRAHDGRAGLSGLADAQDRGGHVRQLDDRHPGGRGGRGVRAAPPGRQHLLARRPVAHPGEGHRHPLRLHPRRPAPRPQLRVSAAHPGAGHAQHRQRVRGVAARRAARAAHRDRGRAR